MDSLLRDINREEGKMRTDVENLFRHFEKLAGFAHQYLEQSTIEWARLLVTHPQTLLLIVETTPISDESGYSYSGEKEPIRLTALHLTSGEIWDQLLHPTYSKRVQGTEYHGLTATDLEDKPVINEAWPNIAEVLENRHIVVFGLDYARSALQSVNHHHALDSAFCLHNRAKEFYSEFYELSLEKVLAYQGINKKRDEMKDSRERVLMLAQVVRNLAAGMKKQEQKSESTAESFFDDDDLGDLDSHPF